MKRLSTILLIATLTLPTFAQLNEDGFYRLQSASSKRYATVVDSKAKKVDVTSTSNADLYAINAKEGFDNIVSDPGSILYLEKSGNNGYIIRSQGLDTYKLSGLYLKIHASNEIEGSYYFYGTKSGMTRYMKEAYNSTFGFYYMATEADRTNKSCSWNIIPVTESAGQYFAVKPEIEIGGKFYATLYASFAYRLSSGMRAYYVRQCNGELAELTEIEGNEIPEATPVIIECASNNTSDNKITPLKNTSTKISQNNLKGVYFCNIIKWADDGEEEHDFFNWNTTSYDVTTMRVLGNINGKLGFVKADNLKYLPANKAYLQVSNNASTSIELVDAAAYAAAGISDITSEKNTNEKGIYSLTGNKVESNYKMPTGVYVIDGKKAILRK